MDIAICRGLFMSRTDWPHDKIYYAAANPDFWKRLVVVKEALHQLDDSFPASWTTNAERFADLLTELTGPQLHRSNQMQAEVNAYWMALGLLCPEKTRIQLMQERELGHRTNHQISLLLQLPETCCDTLLESDFGSEIYDRFVDPS